MGEATQNTAAERLLEVLGDITTKKTRAENAEGQKVRLRPTPSDWQRGKVVRAHSAMRDGRPFRFAGREFKIRAVDWYTRMFTVERKDLPEGEPDGLAFSFDDFEITDHEEPMDLSDPEVRLLEARRQYEKAQREFDAANLAKGAAEEAVAAEKPFVPDTGEDEKPRRGKRGE